MSELYMVAGPIGNLADMTFRAVEVLKGVDVIACEDTRHSVILLNHYGISGKRLISCRAANERQSADGIIKLLGEGKSVAYLSDAGSPGISDPGGILAGAVRDAGFPVIPVPGVSALTALYSICGFPGKGFFFEGFLSPKKGKREKRLTELLETGSNFVIYESPFRILTLLEELKTLAPDHKILVGREITKKFEEYTEGFPENVLALLQNRNTIKGEFTVIIEGKKKS